LKQPYKRTRINEAIQACELRVVSADGSALGVLSREDALSSARSLGLDLIEISPDANPPVAKIMDYGKFQYESKKKQQETKRNAHQSELKNIQVRIGTGDHDLELKAKKISEWLKEGHRIKLDLFLPGRTKYMDINFLKERLNRILVLITEAYHMEREPQKSPKGLSVILDRARKK